MSKNETLDAVAAKLSSLYGNGWTEQGQKARQERDAGGPRAPKAAETPAWLVRARARKAAP